MSKALKAQTEVSYIAEVTPNVTPATPAFIAARVSGESLDVQRTLSYANELNGKRGEKNYALGAAFGTGNISAELYDNAHEDFIAAAVRGTWATDNVKDANDVKSFTLQVKRETGATDIYKRFTGAQVNTMAIDVSAAQRAKIDFGFIARTGDWFDAAIAGATLVAAGTDPVLLGSDISSVSMAGLTIDCIPKLTLNLNNNIEPSYCLGSITPSDLVPGKVEVTGSMEVLLDATQYATLRAYGDGVSTSLQFSIGKGVGTRTRFTLPTIVLEDMKDPTENADGVVSLSFNFRALQSASIGGSVISIDRNL